DFLGQAGRRGVGHAHGDLIRRRGGGRARSYGAAIAALDFAEAPHQPDARTDSAAIKVGNPLLAALAARTDQHLAVGPDPAQPWAAATVRIDLPGVTAITGHLPPVPILEPTRMQGPASKAIAS